MNRREFLGQTAVGLASLSVASSYASPAKKNVIKGKSSQTFKAKMGDIRAVYMQIGTLNWCVRMNFGASRWTGWQNWD